MTKIKGKVKFLIYESSTGYKVGQFLVKNIDNEELIDLKNKTSFKMVEFENEKDDFSEINIKTVTVFEYDALIKKQEENKV